MKTALFLGALFAGLSSTQAAAGQITYGFSGVTDAAITVGGNSIFVGTPFAGTLSYDLGQAGIVTSFLCYQMYPWAFGQSK